MNEEWRDIIGYEGRYQISSEGRIKSCARIVRASFGRERELPELIMQQYVHNNGYLVVFLRRGGDHHCKHFIHRLVYFGFNPDADRTMQVNHCDYERTNNFLANLTLVTGSENIRHAYARIKEENKDF